MYRYAALLRGIAPSQPNMTNDKLRRVFERLGLANVDSVIASGNILFRSPQSDVPALERRIQRALNSELGIPGVTIIRELTELRALLDSDPFPGLTHSPSTYLTATFLKRGTTAPVRLPEQRNVRGRVVGYDAAARAFLAVTDISDPARTPNLMAWLDGVYGKDITTRTWLTVQRIVKKLEI